MVSADLDRDGYSDLVVGAPKEAIGSFKSAGSLTVIWGGAHGLSGGATLLTGNQLYDGIGGKAAVGDFDGDGAMDVVTLGMNGMHILSGPFERDGSAAAVRVIRDMDDLRYLDLAAGDFNGDGRDDWPPSSTTTTSSTPGASSSVTAVPPASARSTPLSNGRTATASRAARPSRPATSTVTSTPTSSWAARSRATTAIWTIRSPWAA